MAWPPHVAGYATPLVTRAGGAVSFALGSDRTQTVRTRLIQLACTNPEPAGPPERFEPVESACPSSVRIAPQALDPGGRLEARWLEAATLTLATIGFGVRPSRTGIRQTILALGDASMDHIKVIRTKDDRLAIHAAGEVVVVGPRLPMVEWTALSITLDFGSGRFALRSRRIAPGLPGDRQGPVEKQEGSFAPGKAPACDHFRLASGAPGSRHCFDGKIDLPIITADARDLLPSLLDEQAEERLAHDPAVLAAFSFRATAEASHADVAGRLVARAAHHPLSAVKGLRWTGETHDRRLKPSHYSALQFNGDAMTDAGWTPQVTLTLPRDLDSGAYALEMVAADGARGFAPFFVSSAGAPRHGLAFLAPTFSYLAYCNAPEAMRGPRSSRGLLPAEALLDAVDGRFGRSLYERFADGAGVVVAGERKPLLSMGPDFRLWGFAADSMLVDWLGKQGLAHDLVTDHDLHRLGADALSGIDVLLTGSHPEYWTTRMWDALSAWLAAGGRLVYLGGNGFYWRTAVAADGAIEVRRAEDGTRPFVGEPGEYVHAFSDEPGGLWRRLGRAPQSLVGVGMAAQGFSRAGRYRKTRQGQDPAMAFIFDGVDGDDFGHGGLMGGAAAGYEIDRYDPALGSDADAWVVATSVGLPDDVLRTKEELLSYVPPFADAKARSDMVLTVRPDGRGAVFAVGSIAWIGSLADPSSDGAAARITRNVVTRFLDRAPLPRQSRRP